MSLRLVSYIELPAHAKEGGFDHAAVHHESSRIYVAHTCNDDVDVVDSNSDRFHRSIHGLKGVAGGLVSGGRRLLFSSNRGGETNSGFSARRGEEKMGAPRGVPPHRLCFV